jgi:hypothetical protein
MRTVLACSLAGLVALSVAAAQADELKSGPQSGQRVGAYNVTKVAGTEDGVAVGANLCYV